MAARRKKNVMTRAYRVFLNDLNQGKSEELKRFLRLCHDVMQYFVDLHLGVKTFRQSWLTCQQFTVLLSASVSQPACPKRCANRRKSSLLVSARRTKSANLDCVATLLHCSIISSRLNHSMVKGSIGVLNLLDLALRRWFVPLRRPSQ